MDTMNVTSFYRATLMQLLYFCCIFKCTWRPGWELL